MPFIKIDHVKKVYQGTVNCEALKEVSFNMDKGEFISIMEPSGSGKTTLLNLVSTIDTPTRGTILIDGQNPQQLKKSELAIFRRRNLGFVFQDFHLLETLTIGENIVIPLVLEGVNITEIEQKLAFTSKRLGIDKILDKRIHEVSGGQKQRAAIARAMIHSPKVLLADEPTGSLDSKASKDVMETIEQLNREDETSIMMVTHDPVAASYCSRVLFIKDGEIYNELVRGERRSVFYQSILDVLSFLGGETIDVSQARF
ncbi:ABC transporter ATP-binding protein [Bacillus aquiflavi]|uniref:ABC transporter ATP-binding protein n=1 Tax=Bacillus aquiflavi TaxID=2672567 RepID=UPI001CA83262|nr:ABC transporter ATP-binding protein [Bacillus aquiflavi]UAC49120.1 ABC transporter ATP-binding protein [Bacillus aquiflavi]